MGSQSNYTSNKFQKILLALLALFFMALILFFKSTIFASTLQLRNFGNLSMDPEIAFTNGKPTYLEFYAEWCEICKEIGLAKNKVLLQQKNYLKKLLQVYKI